MNYAVKLKIIIIIKMWNNPKPNVNYFLFETYVSARFIKNFPVAALWFLRLLTDFAVWFSFGTVCRVKLDYEIFFNSCWDDGPLEVC